MGYANYGIKKFNYYYTSAPQVYRSRQMYISDRIRASRFAFQGNIFSIK